MPHCIVLCKTSYTEYTDKTNTLCFRQGLNLPDLRNWLQKYLLAAGRRLRTRYTTRNHEEEPQDHFPSTEDRPSRHSKDPMEPQSRTVSAVKTPSLAERSMCQSLTFGGANPARRPF
jgi:hypothetical protein